jgi:hypothetical protein
MGARGEAYSLVVPQVKFAGAGARNNRVEFSVSFGKPNVVQSAGAQLNYVDWLQGCVEDGSIGTAVRVMRNVAAAAVFGVVRSGQDPHTAGFNELTVTIDEDKVGVKTPADTVARISINYQGRLSGGPGNAATDTFMSRTAANLFAMGAGDSFSVDGTWNGGMFRLGAYYLWVDGSGRLRIKSSAPTSDADGTAVGDQTG